MSEITMCIVHNTLLMILIVFACYWTESAMPILGLVFTMCYYSPEVSVEKEKTKQMEIKLKELKR